MPLIPPIKPFPTYKWRWAVATPTENLNNPPIFLGVLRAMRENEGNKPNSPAFIKSLALVEKDAAPRLHLSRTGDRNLIRNSGQYWKALGLIEDSHGKIALTVLGQKVADGNITRDEFAFSTVRTLTLPNRKIERDVSAWEKAKLELRPLEIILNVIDGLFERDSEAGYLTREELVLLVIPLAGENRPIADHITAVLAYRSRAIDLSKWPDCTPRSNDIRMAYEFLLFLRNYELLEMRTVEKQNRFYKYIDVKSLLAPKVDPAHPEEIPNLIRRAGFSLIERKRRTSTSIARPGQAKFRRDILKTSGNSCLLTGAALEEALIGAHIIPVENGGEEKAYNGVSLRSDIHALFDARHIRIDRAGNIHLSDAASAVPAYNALPKTIKWPESVSLDAVDWRFRYY